MEGSTLTRDRSKKLKIYERFGVQEYWIVDPDRERIERHTLTAGRYGAPAVLSVGDRLTTPLFPGLTIDLGDVFHNPLQY